MSFDESLDQLFKANVSDKPKPQINTQILLAAPKKQNEPRISHVKVVDPEKDQRTIFVGNVHVKAIQDKKAKKEFEAFFAVYGDLESFRFRSIPVGKSPSRKVAFITKQVREGEDTCNAYVVFKHKDSAEKAVKANGSLLFEHHLRIDRIYSEGSNEKGSKKSVFVGNLATETKEEELWKLFENCGEIESVRIVKDKVSNASKGIGFVNFKDRSSVILAIKLEGTTFKGRQIRVFHYLKHAKEKNDAKKKDTKKAAKPTGPRKPRHRKSKNEKKADQIAK